MKIGDTVLALVNGEQVALTLDDRVLPDRSCHQWEAGWWAWFVDEDNEGPEFFVSDEGIVYGSTEQYPDVFDFSVGKTISNGRAVQ